MILQKKHNLQLIKFETVGKNNINVWNFKTLFYYFQNNLYELPVRRA